jgi:hypothetical protein
VVGAGSWARPHQWDGITEGLALVPLDPNGVGVRFIIPPRP